jgi:tetraacyldisaccharide 4'-kinase
VKRPWLLPLNSLYAAGLAWKNRGLDQHPERAQKLLQPVISIGSLSAGGAGKTPFVIALGNALRSAGYGIDVLSRGHGRTTGETLRVDPTGSATEFGDEPLLIAQRLLCPVYVARERFKAGTWAERDRRHTRNDKHLSLHLLDDGFQHRQLARAIDIVLFTVEDAGDALLPAGNLREPLCSLKRASIIVIREDEATALQPIITKAFANKTPPPIWTIRRRFAFIEGKPSAKPLAFCGIARPNSFRTALTKAGVTPADLIPLRDHQLYNEATIQRLIARTKSTGADGFVTTVKDAVKLTPPLRRTLEAVAPLAIADIAVELDDAPRRVAELIAMIEASWKRTGTTEVAPPSRS